MKIRNRISLLMILPFVLILFAFPTSVHAKMIYPTIHINVGEFLPVDSVITALDIKEEIDTLKIKWEVKNVSIAKAEAKGQIKGLSGGETLVVAKIEGTDVKSTFKLIVHPTVKGITLNKEEISMYVGQDVELSALVFPSTAIEKGIEWKSSNFLVATVKGGIIHGEKAGITTISVSSIDGKYTKKCKVTVKSMVTGIKVNKPEFTVNVGEKGIIVGSVFPSNSYEKTIFYTCTKNGIAEISKDGVITGLKEGTTKVLLKSKDGGHEEIISVAVKSDINNMYFLDTHNKVVNRKDIIVGDTMQITATNDKSNPSSLENYKLTWESEDKSIATVDNKGEITGKKKGITTIIASATQDSKKTKAILVVKVVSTTKCIKVDKKSATVNVGDTINIVSTVTPSNARLKTVKWESDNPNIAKVSNKGVVTGYGAGTAIIKVTTVDGGYTATCKVTVMPVISKITLPKKNVTLNVGDVYKVTPTIYPSTAKIKKTTYINSDNTVLQVKKDTNNNYVITALKRGVATLTIITIDGGKTAVVKITVNDRDLSLNLYDSKGNLITKNK